MTLEDAKQEIEKTIKSQKDAPPESYSDELILGMQLALGVIQRVEPDEEGRAIAWLVVKHGYMIAGDLESVGVYEIWKPREGLGHVMLEETSPVTEAKKLGWGG